MINETIEALFRNVTVYISIHG